MKAISPLAAVVLLALAAPVQAATIEREFRFDADQFKLTTRDGYTEVEARGGSRELRAGRPDLPVFAERLELPAGMRVARVEVISEQRSSLAIGIKPATAFVVGPGLGPVRRTTPDPDFYVAGRASAEASASLANQGVMRGRDVAWLKLQPLRWDAASGRLELVRSLRVRIDLEPYDTPGRAVRQRVVAAWESDADAAAIAARSEPNPARVESDRAPAEPFRATQLPSVLGSPVAYVIITTDALAPSFQPLADWKTATGVPATIRTIEFIRQNYPFGVDDADRVRQFIRDAYTRWGTAWVLLGGDTEAIPTRQAYTKFFGGEFIACDMYFSCVDGNWNADGDDLFGEGADSIGGVPGDQCDLLPDVWVGRAPVATPADVDRFVAKTFQYTRTPVGDYEKNLLFFAEVLFPPDWTSGSTAFDGAELVEECLPSLQNHPGTHFARLYQNYTDARWLPGALLETREAVIDSLDRGYNIACHVGHGFRNVMSVGDANLTNADAEGLTNGNRLFNLYASNCTSNAIDYPCIGEAFLHAANGGAVTNIGSSRFDFPSAGREYQREYFRMLYADSVNAIGELQARQKIPFVPFASEDFVHRWTQMTLLLLGDPELRVWTNNPVNLAVSNPATMALQDTSLTVTVQRNGLPLANARVTLWKVNEDYRSALTNASGIATLDFRPDSLGPISLVVTGRDSRPFQTTITVTPSGQPVLVEEAVSFDDDAVGGTSGNGNGIWEGGETVDVLISVRNTGGSTSSAVTGQLSTADAQVTVVVPSVSYGTVSAGSVVPGATRYRLSTSATVADQREVPLALLLQDNAGRKFRETVWLTVRSPEPAHFSHVVNEIVGNGNGIPTVGETADYSMRLKNLGTGTADVVTAVMRNYDGKATVTDSTASFGTLTPGSETLGDPFRFQVTTAGAKLEIRVSDVYGLLWARTIDLAWPVAPSTLSLVSGSTSMELHWLPNGETDLRGYNIYRATSGAGPFVRVNSVPTERVSYYLDAGLVPLTRYYYRASAVDSSGNESSQTATVNETTTPPNHTIFPLQMGGNTPSSVALARLYHPNTMDIVVGADLLYVFHPSGGAPVDADGSGLTIGDFSLQGTYFAAGPAIGDVDGGLPEIVAPTWTSKQLFVFDLEGNVKPGFPFATGVEVWSSPALGDLDNDGDNEIVMGSNGASLFALRGDGTEWIDGDATPGTLGVFKTLGSLNNFSTAAIADLDVNGEKDIVYCAFNGVLNAWRPSGASLPGFPMNLGGTMTMSPAIGFLDGPGDTSPEIVCMTTGASHDSLYVISATGVRRPGFPIGVYTGGTSKQPSPALADINVDGFVDIVIASTDGRIYVFNGTGSLQPAFFNVRYSALTNAASESSPVVADISGDGIPDIVMGDENTRLNAISGTGAALPGFPIVLNGEVRGAPGLCDCDGDGLSEVVLAGWDQNLYLWDYDFPFSPAGTPAWPQFHHDALRTGFTGTSVALDAPQTAPAPPARVELGPPSPSPMRDGTWISYAVPPAANHQAFELAVFDLTGRRVATLDSGLARTGVHRVEWRRRSDRGAPVGGGVYFVRLRLGGELRSRKMIVMP
ncbi:MAG: hypothetical protein HOP12_10560 [Candidatus Eisenbacteria bacterium]|uniref:Fibronectin type-III domain-containing protein n=1 Tax=Eiseniibacteriota bacterium TaxID=2212470 RepID=A0A849SNZ9_UNCEI|nr:hypothetical protein [Candidatus Eisenbacteria bacterium]